MAQVTLRGFVVWAAGACGKEVAAINFHTTLAVRRLNIVTILSVGALNSRCSVAVGVADKTSGGN